MNKIRISKLKILIILFFIFFSIFGLAQNSQAADSENSQVTKVTRITHPAYTMNNAWQGEGFGGPWNRDYTRIMIFEEQSSFYINPLYGISGRRFVWGYVSQLKALGGGLEYQSTLTEYQAATKQLPTTYRVAPIWSIFEGEENIVYALKDTTKQLVKYNVDTLEETVITSYERVGSTVTSAAIIGWSTDNTLIVAFAGTSSWADGWEINTATTEKTYYASRPSYCSASGDRWPFAKFIHQARSPDTDYFASYYGNSTGSGVTLSTSSPCPGNNYPVVHDYPDPYYSSKAVTHVMWDMNNDWFLGGDNGGGVQALPNITTFHIYQISFDRDTHVFTYNALVTQDSAGRWLGDPPYNVSPYGNYHGLPTPTLRKDSLQLMFMSTNGKYSLEDYKFNNSYTLWNTRGMFLADLSFTNQTDTTPPAAPTGLTVN